LIFVVVFVCFYISNGFADIASKTYADSVVATKVDKVATAAADNFVSFSNAEGQIKDSGKKASDFQPSGAFLTNIEADSATSGVMEKTGADTMATRAINDGAITDGAASLPTTNAVYDAIYRAWNDAY
jgi:hypothetical protein